MPTGKKSGRRRKRGEDFAETDSDEDVVEFCPSPNPEISAALARAITDSEDESLSPTMLTPRVSKEPSLIDSEEGRYTLVLTLTVLLPPSLP